MDFTFSEDQVMVRDLARGILEREVTPERLKRVAAGPESIDRALWRTLAEAGLLGIAVPADVGGMGLGFGELCIFLQETGRAVAPVPALPALVLAGLALAEFGTDEQRKTWLTPLATGEIILTAALQDAGSADLAKPATQAHRDGGAWRLEGEKRLVPAVDLAARILVPATTQSGVGLFLVDPLSEDVTTVRHATSTGEPVFTVTLNWCRADATALLGGGDRDGAMIVRWIYQRALVALCAMQLGVSEKALEVTSAYVRERVQFGVPIGSFQAVQHRAADCYIDLEAMRWVAWRAIWKLGQGQPADRETAIAKFWAAEGGSRIAAAAQHLHAGIGVDLDYPVHRYYLWSKALELALGGAMPHLAALGRDLARTGPSMAA